MVGGGGDALAAPPGEAPGGSPPAHPGAANGEGGCL